MPFLMSRQARQRSLVMTPGKTRGFPSSPSHALTLQGEEHHTHCLGEPYYASDRLS